MLDALLHAVRDALRAGGLGYDYRTCEFTGPEGQPPPRAGDVFLGVHATSAEESNAQNILQEYFSYNITLSMRVTNVPFDRVGDQLLAKEQAESRGFNRRLRDVIVLLHMNWDVIGQANLLMQSWAPDGSTVYGFCEPAMFLSADEASWVTGDWYSAMPEATDVGLKATARFGRCRRFQPMAVFT